jgi:drug/metabolite transporter (DMT)-like permease
LTGNLIGLASGVASGLAYTTVRSLNRTESPLTIMLSFHLMACAFGAITMVTTFVWPTASQWALVLGTALVSQAGQWFLTLGLRQEKTGIATTVSYLAVGFGAMWSYVVFDADVRSRSLLGTGVMVIGFAFLWRARSRA